MNVETSLDIKTVLSDGSVTRPGVRMLMECRVPQLSTRDAFDIYSNDLPEDVTGSVTPEPPIFTSTTASTTTTSNTTTESTQRMKLSGSITTAYAFSEDLNNPESDTFIEYAATVESEMTSIMMQSSMMKSVDLQVTGFQPVSGSRKRRQATTDAKAMAEFEAVVQVPESASMNEVQDALEAEIQSASDDGFDSLDSDSFNTIGVVAEAFITTTPTTKTTTATRTTTYAPTTTTSTTTTTSAIITHDTFYDLHGYHSTPVITTTSSPELVSLSTCPKGNEWFKIDQSKSVSWSWQASISIGRRASAGLLSCSGVILSSDWILTAAGCCIGSIVDEIEVYTGSLDYSHGTMHKAQYYKIQHNVCAIKLEDKIYIDGRSTSVGCFDNESSLQDSNCWMASWPHKVMTHHRQNRLISKYVEIENPGTIGYAECDPYSNQIDFTGSPVMCQTDSVSYISGVIWEDQGNTHHFIPISFWSADNLQLKPSV